MLRVPVLLLIVALTACETPPSVPKAAFARPKPPQVSRLVFAGDVMFSRGVRQAVLAARDPALPFRKVAAFLSAADIAFINLETPFSDRGPYYPGGLIFHASPEMIAGLSLAGIDVASTANNHARDCGSHGVEYTMGWLNKHGILPVGSGPSETAAHTGIILLRNGVRFGFLGYTYDQQNGNWRDIDARIALADVDEMKRDVASMLHRAEVIIVSMHSGTEYQKQPSQKQIQFAHAAVDAGASLVVGHHPHVVQPGELYRGAEIYYSLGNFVFDQFQREQTQHGEILEVSFLGTHILGTRVLPVKITSTGPEFE